MASCWQCRLKNNQAGFSPLDGAEGAWTKQLFYFKTTTNGNRKNYLTLQS